MSDMSATMAPDARENVGLSKDETVRMDAKRSRRFFREMVQLNDAIETLAGVARCFPKRDAMQGTIDPETIVSAMADRMRNTSFLLFAMLNYEEHITEGLQEVEEGAA